jgi:hypothetical protein
MLSTNKTARDVSEKIILSSDNEEDTIMLEWKWPDINSKK